MQDAGDAPYMLAKALLNPQKKAVMITALGSVYLLFASWHRV